MLWTKRRAALTDVRRPDSRVYLVCRAIHDLGGAEEARYYHIRLTLSGETVGRCELHPQHDPAHAFVGNIGYYIKPAHRGRHYAAAACLLLADVARALGMDYLTITCDPDNIASKRTIERLGAQFAQRLTRPAPAGGGSREKLEYVWRLNESGREEEKGETRYGKA